MTTLHAHVSTAASDCDGPIYRDFVVRFSDEEIAESITANGINDFSDIHFKERVLGDNVSLYAENARVNISSRGFEYHEDTEEGYRQVSVIWCEDNCNDSSCQRDIFAEMMRY